MKQKSRKIQPKTLLRNGLSKRITDGVIHFREYHPAKRFSRNLRSLLLDFLMFEGATEVRYLQDLLYDLEGLFELLDAIESEDQAVTHETD